MAIPRLFPAFVKTETLSNTPEDFRPPPGHGQLAFASIEPPAFRRQGAEHRPPST
jgi:hypothetical protein